MSSYDKFYDYLSELHGNQQRLSELLTDKIKAVTGGNLDRLDEIIKDEQVFVLASKSFDANIKRFREQLSLSGEKLSDLIPELPLEEQQRFRDLFKKLSAGLEQTSALNSQCQGLIEGRLHVLDKGVRRLDKSPAKPYGKPEGVQPPSNGTPRLFTKSV